MGQSACVCYWPCLCTSIQGAHMAVRRNKAWIRHKNLNLYSFGRFEKISGRPGRMQFWLEIVFPKPNLRVNLSKRDSRCLACMSWVFCQHSTSLFQNGSKMQLVRAELAQNCACVLLYCPCIFAFVLDNAHIRTYTNVQPYKHIPVCILQRSCAR